MAAVAKSDGENERPRAKIAAGALRPEHLTGRTVRFRIEIAAGEYKGNGGR
jgi:hypothetical protein